MRVYDRNQVGASAVETNSLPGTQSSDRSSEAGDLWSAGDRVELSTTLGNLSHALAADSGSRMTRVRELTSQYQSGSYLPDSLATGYALVEDALGALPN